MQTTKCDIPGMMLISLDVYRDDRGYFLESFQDTRYHDCGINYNFVQDNRSFSRVHILRGMHYQIKRPQGHLVYVLRGTVFDVGVDLRPSSPTFGQWRGFKLSAVAHQQLFLPPGVAHGFCTLSEEVEILYKCTDYYDPKDEGGVLWSDPTVAIDWPDCNPLIHPRDKAFPLLSEIPPERFPDIRI